MKKELQVIKEQIQVEKNGRGYDARKKAYKDGQKEIDRLVNEGKMIVVKDAIKKLSTLGYTFEVEENKYHGPLGVYKTVSGLWFYAKPWFSEYMSNSDPHFGIYLSLGNYARALLVSNDKLFDINIGGVMAEQLKKHLAAEKIKEKNNSNANKLYNLMKDVLSYKSYSSLFERGKLPWAGDKIQVEYKSIEESWHDSAMLEFEFRNEQFEVEARMRFDLLTANDCHNFWKEFDALVKKYTDFIRKKETTY